MNNKAFALIVATVHGFNTTMRTHKPVGVSIPQEMYDRINTAAQSEGLKRSAWFQQLLIRELKTLFPGVTTEELMGTADRKPKPKLTPAQRVAIAKLALAKRTKRTKRTK